jgi:hypothetical protein
MWIPKRSHFVFETVVHNVNTHLNGHATLSVSWLTKTLVEYAAISEYGSIRRCSHTQDNPSGHL